jgi:uncharacterized protein (TIGR02145 family)
MKTHVLIVISACIVFSCSKKNNPNNNNADQNNPIEYDGVYKAEGSIPELEGKDSKIYLKIEGNHIRFCNGGSEQITEFNRADTTIVFNYDDKTFTCKLVGYGYGTQIAFKDLGQGWHAGYETDGITIFRKTTDTYPCEDNSTTATLAVDADGNTYKGIQINGQTWLNANLNTSHYNNGDVIPYVENQNDWAALTTGAWCYTYNYATNGITVGKLYNWFAINDPRGIAPAGWHVATNNDWNELFNFLGNSFKLKGYGWANNIDNEDFYGFSAYPGGTRGDSNNPASSAYGFSYNNYTSAWWSSDSNNNLHAYGCYINTGPNYTIDLAVKKGGAFVRCVKD